VKRRPYRRPVVLAAVVTEDGTLALEPRAQRQLAKLGAGAEVFVTVAPRPHRPPSQALRGYYFAALVDVAMCEFGYVTKDEAHEAVVKWICCCWWEKARPSFSNAAMTHDEMADAVDRMCAELLMRWGIEVPDAEVDPVRRLELTGR
jgi:hypothetical protein